MQFSAGDTTSNTAIVKIGTNGYVDVWNKTKAYTEQRIVFGKPLSKFQVNQFKFVDMLGNDFLLSDGIWTCGKDGQSVPVNVGTPTVRIASITVGGTQV